MPTKTPVSEKNTKGEIFDAYRRLVSEVQSSSGLSVPFEDKKILDQAQSQTVEKIVEDLTRLKLSLNQTISELTDKLTAEAERFTMLKKAAELTQKELAETEQIKVQLGLLKKLIDTHAQKQTELEKEITSKRAEWAEEQKSYQDGLKKERTRETEEYEYAFKQKKTRDSQEQDEVRRLFEKEMAQKKAEYKAMETELLDLRKRAASWESEREAAIKQAVALVEANLKREAEISAKLAKQEAQSQLSLKELKIETLSESVKQQQNEIVRLHTELKAATAQVKDIAISAVEGSRKMESPPASQTVSK